MASYASLAAGTNAGGSPPTPVLSSDSGDGYGSLTFGTGTAPAAGAQVVLTLGAYYNSSVDAPATVCCIVAPLNTATGALGPWSAVCTTHAVTFECAVAPSASQANTTYALSYRLVP